MHDGTCIDESGLYRDPRSIYTDALNGTILGGRRTRNELIDRSRAIHTVCGGQRVIYALRLCDGVVKIGCTGDLPARIRHYQGCDILAFMPGEYEDEQAIHASLVPYRHHGREYYHATPEVLAVVNKMRERFGLEPLAA